ncbi:MAG: flagellar biosynthesis protein FlgE [Arcobacter sp.]|nr:MAG: flagellar biosynthesis protein FlgE [Arcobacter sp.]
MIGALWTGISGLASHQTALDNESHNIANVNTVGYKASRISFADQMYQDRIGKGSKILDAEKLYVQGNLKLTGVDYDMALSGDGFFTVLNTRSSGSAETLYTRAGNFRMGDNGTLQDAAGNEVQGWSMRDLDTNTDVTSTNPNVKMFTNDYTKLLTSKVINHSTYIETITAKATDYAASAKADSGVIYDGAGGKSKSAKVSDVEALVSNYATWLSKLKDDPDGGSASSTAQVSQINFKSGADALISKDGDQIYAYINGEKISQNFVTTTSDFNFKVELYAADNTLADPGTVASPNTLTASEIAEYDKIASRIETYKALANKISEKPGLRAYVADESDVSLNNNDVLQKTENFKLSTSVADMLKGIIQIESLIPGDEFTISEIGESSGQNTVAGAHQTGTTAIQGSGIGALQSARDALSEVITGKQQDVYTVSDLGLSEPNTVVAPTALDFSYGITIYDKDLDKVIPVPGDNSTTPAIAHNIFIDGATSIDDIVDAINGTTPYSYLDPKDGSIPSTNSFDLSDYVIAKNINGNLVIETLDENFDVEFSGAIKSAPGATDTVASDPKTIASYTPLDKNNDYSGRKGAGAEFIELVNTVDQTTTQTSLQLKLDTLGISDSAFGQFSVDSSGVITMKQDGAEFAIGQVSIALFNNNRGLDPAGDNLLAKTNDSGEPIYNLNNDKTAKIEGQTLELSTADLSESLVNLMVFQRAFEANAKSITTSDEILNTLINLKR